MPYASPIASRASTTTTVASRSMSMMRGPPPALLAKERPPPGATGGGPAAAPTPADEQGRAKSCLTAANACHLVLVEVDAETGKVEIPRYWIADDCGTRHDTCPHRQRGENREGRFHEARDAIPPRPHP